MQDKNDAEASPELRATVQILQSYLRTQQVSVDELLALITSIRACVRSQSRPHTVDPVKQLIPAVPIKRSIEPDYIICLEDGRRFKSIRRHIQENYGLSPVQYRQKWGLPPDYPMVAPNYSRRRAELARLIRMKGQGREDSGSE